MRNPVCFMVLNQEPKPEGIQVYRANNQGSLAKVCRNQWARTLLLYNWISTLQMHLSICNKWHFLLHKCLLVRQVGNQGLRNWPELLWPMSQVIAVGLLLLWLRKPTGFPYGGEPRVTCTSWKFLFKVAMEVQWCRPMGSFWLIMYVDRDG